MAILVYVFKSRFIYALLPTGIADATYRVQRVTDQCGANAQFGITLGETPSGQPCVYFLSSWYPSFHLMRLQGFSLDILSMDCIQEDSGAPGTENGLFGAGTRCVWHPTSRTLELSTWRLFTTFQMQVDGVWRGGWVQRTIPTGHAHAAIFPLSSRDTLYVGQRQRVNGAYPYAVRRQLPRPRDRLRVQPLPDHAQKVKPAPGRYARLGFSGQIHEG